MDERVRQRSLFAFDGGDDPPSPPGENAGSKPLVPNSLPSEGGQAASHLSEPTEAVAAQTPASKPAPVAVPDESGSLAGKTVYAIDAHSLIYQVFHALPEMSSPRGEPVGAVYGFARDLLFLLETKKPDYLLCAFDLPGKTFRHTLYERYKIERAAMPEDLVPQIAMVRQLIEVLGVPALGVKSFEADDVLATLACQAEEAGARCFLVTGDKDCRQLITDQVFVYNIRKDQVFDREALQAEWGIAPEQVVDFQALVGDSVDNVPGVPLIGPKLARQLLEKYGTLDEVLAHADEVSGAKRKQNLIEGREQALLSRELVRLSKDVPIDIDWSSARAGQIDRARASELFARLGFRGLAQKIDDLAASLGNPVLADSPPAERVTYRVVDTPEALDALVSELSQLEAFAVDTETKNISAQWSDKVWPRWSKIVGLSFAWRDDEAVYVPVRGPAGERFLDPDKTLDRLRPVLENPAIGKVGQNLKYDMVVLRGAGVRLAGVQFDTMVASYLLDAGARNHNLDELARRYLGHETIKISELIGSGKSQKPMDEVPIRQIADYAGEDALVTWRLRPILAKRLSEANLDELFTELEVPLIDVLAELEYNGIRVDVARLHELSGEYGERIASLEQEIHQLAGHPFNVASPKQLQEVLFSELELPVVKKTKTGPSTDASVLEELAAEHPLPAKIVEYRQYAKLKGTYVDALPQMVHPETGRVHASFNQGVAATGRLSSSDPNLQNIPVRTEAGREIRSAFVPGEKGWVLLAADYSQIELRVLAHFSGDERLCQAFRDDEDIHARVASQVYGVPLDEVAGDMRRKAKTVNFGIIYGQSPFGLAKQLKIDPQEAAAFIDAYFEGYPGVQAFLSEVLAECLASGYVSTILGRRRAIRGVRPEAVQQRPKGGQRNLAERTAINTVIQGSAADLIKQAMIAIHRRFERERIPARTLLQIHDELIFELPPQALDHVTALVVEEMAGAQTLAVPLKVDVKSGPNWADTN